MTKLAHFISAALLTSAGFCYAGQAAASRGDRFEVSAIKAVRPSLVNTLAALKKGDVAEAKAAFEAYDSGWNGIEVYINTRDKSMYDELEKNLQERITQGLASPNPDVAALTTDAQTMLAKFDEAIANAEKSAAGWASRSRAAAKSWPAAGHPSVPRKSRAAIEICSPGATRANHRRGQDRSCSSRRGRAISADRT